MQEDLKWTAVDANVLNILRLFLTFSN
jgi:hypothetical protein